MSETISAAEAKTHLAALLSGVFHRGERYVIERRGKPVAALVPIHDVSEPTPDAPFTGFLTLAGGWADVADAEIDELVLDLHLGAVKRNARGVG